MAYVDHERLRRLTMGLEDADSPTDRRASREEAEAREKEARLREQREREMGSGPVRKIPSDLYSVRQVPDGNKGGQMGRDKLRDTIQYWQVLCPTSSYTPSGGRGPTEEQLKEWGQFLGKYVTEHFRKPLKSRMKTKMVQMMVETNRGVKGIRFRKTNAQPVDFHQLKQYIKEEMNPLPTEEFDEVIRRLFHIMYGMFRTRQNRWMLDMCDEVMSEKRLGCKFNSAGFCSRNDCLVVFFVQYINGLLTDKKNATSLGWSNRRRIFETDLFQGEVRPSETAEPFPLDSVWHETSRCQAG